MNSQVCRVLLRVRLYHGLRRAFLESKDSETGPTSWTSTAPLLWLYFPAAKASRTGVGAGDVGILVFFDDIVGGCKRVAVAEDRCSWARRRERFDDVCRMFLHVGQLRGQVPLPPPL